MALSAWPHRSPRGDTVTEVTGPWPNFPLVTRILNMASTIDQKENNLNASDDVEGGEALNLSVFASYQCSVEEIRRRCKEHPGDISEASSLS